MYDTPHYLYVVVCVWDKCDALELFVIKWGRKKDHTFRRK